MKFCKIFTKIYVRQCGVLQKILQNLQARPQSLLYFCIDFDLNFCNFAQTLQNFCKNLAIVQIYIYIILQKNLQNILQKFLASLEIFAKGETLRVSGGMGWG